MSGQANYTKHLELALTDTFQKSLSKLEAKDQAAVNDALLKFYNGHTAVDLHDVGQFKGLKVSRNAMRIVCQQEGRTLLLLYVGQHDRAYEWGERHKLVQHGNVLRVRRLPVVEDAPREDVAPTLVLSGPLSPFKDKEFGWFDIEPPAAAVLRQVPDDDALLDVADLLKPPLAEALLNLAGDPDDASRIANQYQRRLEEERNMAPVQPSLTDVVNDPINAGVVWVPPPSEEALVRALEGDLQGWRTFLHPSQKRLVTMHAKGAVKVTGGPGTGKSVVAVHRARHLASDVFADDGRPILVTSFSNPLTRELGTMVDALVEGVQPEGARTEGEAEGSSLGHVAPIQVMTLTQVAQRILKDAGAPHLMLPGGDVQAAWAEALKADTLGFDRSFYEAERNHVVVRHGAWTGTQYITANRGGLGTRLGRAKRIAVWKVLEAFEAALQKRGGGDVAALARDAAVTLRKGGPVPWAAVVCDEVQDAGAAELRMLAAIAADDLGKVKPNGLFMVGDGYQRLYSRPVQLSRCGIEVRGRSKRLRLNYRTTEQIRRAAVRVVEGLGLDMLDQDDDDTSAPLDGYRSLRGGPAPVVVRLDSEEAEADWVVEQVGARNEQVLVLARTTKYLEGLQQRLMTRGLQGRILEAGERPESGERVVLCSMHRAKGLEAPSVILAGAHKVPLKWHGKGGAADKALWVRQETCLQYVAMTRARDWLGISRVGS